MTRLVLHEATRWVRALAFPLVGLTVVVLLNQPGGVLQSARPISHARTVWAVALAAALVWLAIAVLRAALQPRRDRHAAEHLQDMRVRACLPDHALVCILRVLWTSPAGERVAAADVRTGAVIDIWLAEARIEPRSYALVRFDRGAGVLLDNTDPAAVAAARRHDTRHSAAPRRLRLSRMAAKVVREAERLTHAA